MMEKRTTLAMILSILVFIIWMEYFIKPYTNKSKTAQTDTIDLSDDNDTPDELKENADTPVIKKETIKPSENNKEGSEKKIVSEFKETSVIEAELKIDTSLITAIFTNKGARLKELYLKNYKSLDGKSDLKLLYDITDSIHSWTILEDEKNLYLAENNWEISEQDNNKVTFKYVTNDGNEITKTYTFNEKTYIFNLKITMKNLSSEEALAHHYALIGPAGIVPEISYAVPIYLVGYSKNEDNEWEEEDEVKLQKLSSKPEKYLKQDTPLYKMTALCNKYFACVIMPEEPDKTVNTFSYFPIKSNSLINEMKSKGNKKKQYDNAGIKILFLNEQLNPLEEKEFSVDIFAGPKDPDLLAATDYSSKGLDKLINYGMFGIISKILLKILGFFYLIFRNYGVAVILLTLLVKLVLFPLTKNQQISMIRMQKLSPKMKELRVKYKDNQKKLNKAMMELYKEYHVNPLGGCLPIFVQIPVFIGLYQGIRYSLNMRLAPFMLWINDLSSPDMFGKLPFKILGTDQIHFLPILMAVLWIGQSIVQPKSPDPKARQQQKMFMFMPLIFLLFLYKAPAGLILYFVVNSLLGIIETQLIKKVFIAREQQ